MKAITWENAYTEKRYKQDTYMKEEHADTSNPVFDVIYSYRQQLYTAHAHL
jgi:hypothetical protein